ncbi:putative leucine-rich repeat-containing, plant-type, leucine-rich repeat domain, L [Rosa chinensis]|uniref:Putative leucine-rich repeat-containing, plant-type, leucine-rich repeat domain, L n=1 Tax=Rosa chinensis TaxID=74649 RepID=A0A2P6R368_ROSCH|nr:putative leucine-rich repeat-containing, plant-type, leucine-rich repeat domain, L [Rosa chinensis]
MLDFLEATRLANSGVNSFKVACIELERKALLKFKQGLEDPLHKFSSWVGEDCCNWLGVGCCNKTGNVVKLDLSYCCCIQSMKPFTMACIGGELDSSLLDILELLGPESQQGQWNSYPKFHRFTQQVEAP